MRFPVWQRHSKARREVICQERRAFKQQARQIISTNWAHNCHTNTHTHTHTHTANRSALNATCGLVERARHYFRSITLPLLCSEVRTISNSVWQLEPWQMWRFVTLLDYTKCWIWMYCVFSNTYISWCLGNPLLAPEEWLLTTFDKEPHTLLQAGSRNGLLKYQ